MKLGFVSAILPELSLEELARFAGEQDFDCVEVMCWPKGRAERRYAGVTHVDVADLTEAAVAQVREVTSRHGIEISGLGYYPNPLAPDRAEAEVYVEHIRRVILAAERLGIG